MEEQWFQVGCRVRVATHCGAPFYANSKYRVCLTLQTTELLSDTSVATTILSLRRNPWYPVSLHLGPHPVPQFRVDNH